MEGRCLFFIQSGKILAQYTYVYCNTQSNNYENYTKTYFFFKYIQWLLISSVTCKDFGSHYSILATSEKWTDWKVINSSKIHRKDEDTGNPCPQDWRDRQADTGSLHLLEQRLTGIIHCGTVAGVEIPKLYLTVYWGFPMDNSWIETWGRPIPRDPHKFCEIYLQNFNQFSQVILGKIPLCF